MTATKRRVAAKKTAVVKKRVRPFVRQVAFTTPEVHRSASPGWLRVHTSGFRYWDMYLGVQDGVLWLNIGCQSHSVAEWKEFAAQARQAQDGPANERRKLRRYLEANYAEKGSSILLRLTDRANFQAQWLSALEGLLRWITRHGKSLRQQMAVAR